MQRKFRQKLTKPRLSGYSSSETKCTQTVYVLQLTDSWVVLASLIYSVEQFLGLLRKFLHAVCPMCKKEEKISIEIETSKAVIAKCFTLFSVSP